MTHQQMIDYWKRETREYEKEYFSSSSSDLDLKRIHELDVLIKQSRNIHMQLCAMETSEPATITSTDFEMELEVIDFLAQLVNNMRAKEQGYVASPRWLCTREDLKVECKQEAFKLFLEWKEDELIARKGIDEMNAKLTTLFSIDHNKR